MADISQELSQIKNSVYGKTMRTAIHDAIKKVNEDPSGGGGIIIDTLWSSDTGATVGTEYTMSSSIYDYDILYLKIGNTKDIESQNSYVQASLLTSLINSEEDCAIECFYYQRSLHISFDEDSFTVTQSMANGENSGYKPILWKIVGVKY